MKNRSFAFALSLLLVGGTSASADEVTYAGPGGLYQELMKSTTFDPAKAKYGLTVNLDNIKSIADARMQVQSGNPSWDIVEVPQQQCRSAEADTLFEDIDYSLVPNAADMPDNLKGKNWIGGFTRYAMVLVWNKKTYGDNPPGRWADFFDVEKFPGTRAMYNQPRMMAELTLLGDGVDKAKMYPLDVDRAIRKMEDFRKNITVFYETYGQATQLLANGEIDMMALTNGRASAVTAEYDHFAYTLNEGIADNGCLAILKGSKNREAAMKALNAFIDREFQANIGAQSTYGPVNPKAFEVGTISADKMALLPTYAPVLEKMLLLDAGWWAKNEVDVVPRWLRMMQK